MSNMENPVQPSSLSILVPASMATSLGCGDDGRRVPQGARRVLLDDDTPAGGETHLADWSLKNVAMCMPLSPPGIRSWMTSVPA